MSDSSAPISTEPAADTAPPWPYQRVEGHFDEMLASDGSLRPHWRKLMHLLGDRDLDELDRSADQARRLIHENGVTYNVHGDPQGADRAWQLDALPMVIADREWQSVADGIQQRAVLLNRLIGDIYGSQQLLKDGHLPAELVYACPDFLRPMCGAPQPGGVYLHLYAADLARSPDGQWWVLGDRTQAPSGAGYTLENRVVLSRTQADPFQACQVRRLSEFFAAMRDALIGMAPAHKENPRIVLLTPGPWNETYFEHAYLARYLGFNLVEGSDLTVRDERVYLKTLSGLLPVDVILRRVDADFCDPLELRDDSMLGVPGLMLAVRAGNVLVANAPGSGVAQTTALMPFLPGLCRTVLGEELKIPGVATWWMGQADARAAATAQIDRIVVKHTFPTFDSEPIFCDQLSKLDRTKLLDRIHTQPHRFIAQEQVALSTTPTWVGGGIQPRHMILRVYAVATGLDSYAIMPGGLTRLSASSDSLVVSTQRGGGSKDTWVLSDQPVQASSLLPRAGRTATLTRAGFVLPSRIADNLFWLGRYTERVDHTSRLMRCMLDRLTTETSFLDLHELPTLLNVLAEQGRLAFPEEGESWPTVQPALWEPLLRAAMFDEENAGSLVHDVRRVQRIAMTSRDRMSMDSWRILTRLVDEFVPPAGRSGQLQALLKLVEHIVLTLAAFSGQCQEGMTREKGWRFLDIGRRVERTLNLGMLLRAVLAREDAGEPARLQAMLEVANSAMTYRSRYMASVQPAPALDLLLSDETNPRSLAFQLAALLTHVEKLRPESESIDRPAEQRITLAMLTELRLANVDELGQAGRNRQRPRLNALLDRVARSMEDLSLQLSRSYLSHANPILPRFGVAAP